MTALLIGAQLRGYPDKEMYRIPKIEGPQGNIGCL